MYGLTTLSDSLKNKGESRNRFKNGAKPKSLKSRRFIFKKNEKIFNV